MSTYLFQIQSAIIVVILFYGLSKRKDRNKHPQIMQLAIVWDLILVAQIELNRGAIMRASKAMTNPMILNIHVSLAVTTVVFYSVMYFTGKKLLAGDMTKRVMHKYFGIINMSLRLLTLITSFMI